MSNSATFSNSQHFLAGGCPITKADCRAIWREIRKPTLDNGYRLVAVHSAYSLAVSPGGRGKQPLTEIVNGEKQSWTKGHSIDRLSRVTPLSSNTGVLSGEVVALDLDPSKTASAVAQWDYTIGMLRLLYGDRLGPLLRAGLLRLRAPGSALLLVRANRSMTKTVVAGERGKVELLGEGQQCLVHGWHPKSLDGPPVLWEWSHDRSPWTVPVAALPVVPVEELTALMDRIGGSGVLGPPVARVANTTAVVGRGRFAAYPATARLNELLAQHNDLIKPAVRRLIEEVGKAREGRHDAVVAICGRLAYQKWPDQEAVDWLTPIVNEHFQDGDWTCEIERAVSHAHRKEMARIAKVKTVVWRN